MPMCFSSMCRHQVHFEVPRCFVILVVIFSACGVRAQLRSVPSPIALTAKLEGYVTLADQRLPLSLILKNGGQLELKVPIDVTWNLDPQVTQSFRVIGVFQQNKRALTSGAETVASTDIQARLDETEFRTFHEKGNHLVLFNVTIDHDNRRGHMQRMLELRLTNQALLKLRDGIYQGWLNLEVQQQY
jgi:hypothetical protein